MRIRSLFITNYANVEPGRFSITGPSTLSLTGNEEWDDVIVALWKMVFRRKLDRFQFDDPMKPVEMELAFQVSFGRDMNRTQIGVDKRVVDHMKADMLFLKLVFPGANEKVLVYIGESLDGSWTKTNEGVFISTLRDLCMTDDKEGVMHFIRTLDRPVFVNR